MTYVTFDEFEDVVFSLKLLSEALEKTKLDIKYWKPAILFAHSALQGACVCLLTRTDGGGALTKKSEIANLNHLRGKNDKGWLTDDPDIEWPKISVAPLPELLERLPDELSVKLPKWNENEKYDFD